MCLFVAKIQTGLATRAVLTGRQKDQLQEGLKQDSLAYEAIVESIANVKACFARARDLLDALTCALTEQRTERFVNESTASPSIRVFVP